VAKTKQKSCACEIRNPSGKCCLADFPKSANKIEKKTAIEAQASLKIDVDAEQLIAALELPKLSQAEQNMALAIYRLLAQTGKPVDLPQLADYLQWVLKDVQNIMADWQGIQTNEDRQIIAFMGLTTQKTAHSFQVNDHTLYTWCAWDSLFIPQLLAMPARIRSISPTDGTPIEIDIEGYEVDNLSSQQIHVSFKMPGHQYSSAEIVQQFCCNIHFFTDESSANGWLKEHPGTGLMTLQAALELGKAFNESRFPNSYPALHPSPYMTKV